MRTPAGARFAFVAFCALGFPDMALAQGAAPAAPSAPTRVEDTVMAHLRRARAARDAKKWPEAEAAFEAALAAMEPSRATEPVRAELLGELGLAELGQKKYRDAAEHIAQSLALGGTSMNPALERRLEEGQRIAEKHVARIYLGVTPSDAEVLVDGRALPEHKSSHELFLDPGKHEIRARLDGYGDARTTVHAAAGDSPDIRLNLEHDAPVSVTSSTPIAAPATMPDQEVSGGLRSALRTTGLVLTGSATALGVSLLAWGAHTASDAQDRVTELQKKGWATSACLGPDAPVECQELASAQKRRAQLVDAGIASLAAGGGLAVLTAASYVLLPVGPARLANDAAVRVV
ncbi:MAG: PEGA domain-containing protein, partial [Polyangiaceae bacterium]|nr:PEGA domain-containing protein [Polyangiaceae bacterium]